MRRLAVDLSERQEQILQLFNYTSWDDFLAALGYGGVSTQTIARRGGALIPDEEGPEPPPALPEKRAPAMIGSPGLRVLRLGNPPPTMAPRSNPGPGDPTLGYRTPAPARAVRRA